MALPTPPRRLAAAQLAAFVPCSILEALPSPGEAPAVPAPANGGNGASSDAECVMVEAPLAVEPLAGGGSSASLEAVPAGDSDALLLLATNSASLRQAAVAYLDGLVARVGGGTGGCCCAGSWQARAWGWQGQRWRAAGQSCKPPGPSRLKTPASLSHQLLSLPPPPFLHSTV